MKTVKLLFFTALVMSISACGTHTDLNDGIYAEFKTNKGDFITQLYYQEAPMTVANFVSLAEGNHPDVKDEYQDKKFYNGLMFHRVIDGFMIQGGDPQGTGQGGPGYKFPDEINDSLIHDSKGVLSMANAGPNTNGSQFFITLAPQKRLNGSYSVFGQVIEGQKTVDSIGSVETNDADKPLEDVVIKKVNIIEKGSDAKNFDAPKVFKEEVKKNKKRIAKEKAEAKARQKKQAEKIKKQINEMAGEDFKKTSSGLRYKITQENSDGEKPQPGQIVNVHYTGKLKDGEVFDSSRKRGEPISFPIGKGKVIPGWDEGIQLLKTGEKARLIIPPSLGYGQRATGPIPANSILIFDVELMGIGQ